jgi:hypothetical protein
MAKSGWVLGGMLAVACAPGWGRGVTPYLPLNLEPEIESKIERVLVLADKPVMTRPIPAAMVLDALPRACLIDATLCEEVRQFLQRYERDAGLSYASGEISASNGVEHPIPNQHGLTTSSHYDVDAAAYYEPFDHLLISLGGIVYEGRARATGSMVSAGWDFLQLDVGFRDHWWSPATDSGQLISTNAPTMPSVTISNYRPLTRLGFQYELFVAQMSESTHILNEHLMEVTGKPQFAGLHLQIEPVSGWAVSFNRILQYGGGGPGGDSFSKVLRAFFDPVGSQNNGTVPGENMAFGNQEASMTTRFIYPGPVPFAVYFEYAGEDTSRGRSYLLGNTDFTGGIHFPKLGPFEVTYEISDWQDLWYVHGVYLDGLTNYGRVTGNWFGDQRQFNNAVGGQTNMVKVGWEPPFGGLLEEQFRTITNESYFGVSYKHGFDGMVRYSYPWKDYTIGGELYAGRDVFGGHFARIAAFMRLGNEWNGSPQESDEAAAEALGNTGTQWFIDAGGNAYQLLIDLTNVEPRTQTPTMYSPHLGLGVRRMVSDHQDLGARLEVDDIDSHALISARMVDYRYRFTGHLALDAFLGASRYALGTAAYGWYIGGGAQYRDVLPGWDLGIDYRYGVKVARDHVLPSDPQGNREDSFYDIYMLTFYISKHF